MNFSMKNKLLCRKGTWKRALYKRISFTTVFMTLKFLLCSYVIRLCMCMHVCNTMYVLICVLLCGVCQYMHIVLCKQTCKQLIFIYVKYYTFTIYINLRAQMTTFIDKIKYTNIHIQYLYTTQTYNDTFWMCLVHIENNFILIFNPNYNMQV